MCTLYHISQEKSSFKEHNHVYSVAEVLLFQDTHVPVELIRVIVPHLAQVAIHSAVETLTAGEHFDCVHNLISIHCYYTSFTLILSICALWSTREPCSHVLGYSVKAVSSLGNIRRWVFLDKVGEHSDIYEHFLAFAPGSVLREHSVSTLYSHDY